MSTLLNLLLLIIAAAIIIEILARIYFKHRYLIPFRSRMIEEYPYNDFIEKIPAPLHYRFKKNFKSKTVNINRFGCRGPEPAPTGEKKRVLLIGESTFFGVKLRYESELWDARLKALLKRHQISDWEIINGGTPIYNSTQHRLYWEKEMAALKPDIVIIGFGINDLSQVWMMGSKWDSSIVWPEKFILALERKSPRLKRYLSNLCCYLLWRRNHSDHKDFPRMDEEFQWTKCLTLIENNYRSLSQLAQSYGAQVATILIGTSFDSEPTPDDARRLNGIQANWRMFQSGRGAYDILLINEMRKMSKKLQLPYIDLDETLRRNPRRYELYLDIIHLNDAGMRVVARTIYNEIEKLGWWK